MAVARKRPTMIELQPTFCPGCGHGNASRLLAEVIEEKGLLDNFIMAMGVGCCASMRRHWGGEILQCAHGRPAAAARGLKIGRPDACVVTYHGDGDAYVIGLQETLNAAYTNANITMIVINNTNFAMTGGQMSWTTLPGQKTTTSTRGGRQDGHQPLRVPEIIARDFDVAFVARGSLASAAEINKSKRLIQTAVECQLEGRGFSLVELLSPCPTNWGMSTRQACEHVTEVVSQYYPIGILKDVEKEGEK